jgi:alkanesulfonate monooxygenase SsuD/methylene tetrahydromethanopterin reductase-like flavin-dependent oxidoreductase (luciferase family)
MSRAPGPDIQVGICLGFQNPLQWRIPWPRLYQECLELVDAAEALGFDEVWLSEHHFVDDGYCPSLLPVAAAIAARTKRVRIGTKVMLLPFHDPVRLAEDAAVVDVLSNGRLDLGLAAGYRLAEFAGFNIDPSERGARMDESLQVLRQALTGEPFEYAGRFYRYGRVQVVPPPVQQQPESGLPAVPIWLGGRSRAAMRRAAVNGCHLQLADFVLANALADYRAYVGALQDAGRDPAEYKIAAVGTMFVDEDAERAWHIAGPHLLYQQNQYCQWFAEAGDRPTDQFKPISDPHDLPEGSYLIGAPGDVLPRIRDLYRQVPFTHFAFWVLLPGMRLAAALKSLELTARHLLPALRHLAADRITYKERTHVASHDAG